MEDRRPIATIEELRRFMWRRGFKLADVEEPALAFVVATLEPAVPAFSADDRGWHGEPITADEAMDPPGFALDVVDRLVEAAMMLELRRVLAVRFELRIATAGEGPYRTPAPALSVSITPGVAIRPRRGMVPLEVRAHHANGTPEVDDATRVAIAETLRTVLS